MKHNRITPEKWIKKNKALYNRTIEPDKFNKFKSSLKEFIKQSKDQNRTENNHKALFQKFLENNFYEKYIIEPNVNNMDLVIRDKEKTNNNKNIIAIIEAKRTTNVGEMISANKESAKALKELVLYFLRERYKYYERYRKNNNFKPPQDPDEDSEINNNILGLMITNYNEFYIYKAKDFYKIFCNNTFFKNEYVPLELKKTTTPGNTDEHHRIIKNYLDNKIKKIDCLYFNLDDYKNDLEYSNDRNSNERLRILYNVFEPKNFAPIQQETERYVLNTKFYKELLYIIGLEEYKDKGKIKIKVSNISGTLIANTKLQLHREYPFNFNRDELSEFGTEKDKQIDNIALALNILWINRILFLKLLEGQLLNYHNYNEKYKFLKFSNSKINDFDDLFSLFHNILAIPHSERNISIKEKFDFIPYLNSTLFEKDILEIKSNINIGSLLNNVDILMMKGSILGKSHNINTLKYLLDFLYAYDFTSDESKNANKNIIINASVLGKVFEKINGYKEGSYFTPGYITEYICRETVRPAVIEKFNEKYKLEYDDFKDLKSYISKKLRIFDKSKVLEYNNIINELRICDPAVGSGHFLVSALNEIIKIKSELGIIADSEGYTDITDKYIFEIKNDELLIKNKDKEIFCYKIKENTDLSREPVNNKDQKLQEILFHEKKYLIENCLFGVDINPNSVNICRLRLWIELLKNAYYKKETNYTELETLPNIDINIKCGNSLISKYKLESDLKQIPDIKNHIDKYKKKVKEYKNTRSKESKSEINKAISEIKQKYLFKQLNLFTLENGEKEDIYRNAFEWRLEFPEVLSKEGDFIGFDVVIGNPPYIRADIDDLKYKNFRKWVERNYLTTYEKWDIMIPFFEKGINILKQYGYHSFIVSESIISSKYAYKLQDWIKANFTIKKINYFNKIEIFKGVGVIPVIIEIYKSKNENYHLEKINRYNEFNNYKISSINITNNMDRAEIFKIDFKKEIIYKDTTPLGDICYISKGMVLNSDEKTNKLAFTKDDLLSDVKDHIHSKRIVEGKDLKSYYIEKEKYIEWNTERVPNLLSRKTFPELYEGEKILRGRVTKGTFDNTGIVCNDGVIVFKRFIELAHINNKSINISVKKNNKSNRYLLENISENFYLKYLLAIINSEFAMNYLNNIRRHRIKNYFYPDDFRKLPIKNISLVEQNKFIDIVDKIIKEKSKLIPTSNLEKELDRMVIQLYNHIT